MVGTPIALLINVPTGRRSAMTKKVAATRYGPLAVCVCDEGAVVIHADSGMPLGVLPNLYDAARAVEWLIGRQLDWVTDRRFGRVVFSDGVSAAVATLQRG